MHHGIYQTVLADKSGYEQTYFSALEVGKKGSPTQEFVEKLISALNLSGEERDRLLKASIIDTSIKLVIIDIWVLLKIENIGKKPINIFVLCIQNKKL